VAGSYGRGADLNLSLAEGAARIQDIYLRKIVEAVVDNAFKFSDIGSSVRVVGLREKDFYVLAVSDEGRGMDDDQLQQVGAFVQFERDQYEQQGLGLGLSIARRLAELHRGALRLESAPDEGTTVWVWLPLAD
jgi:signal transduction histidine kinase